jgi:hypothetical protein
MGVSVTPMETDAELFVDPDAVLPFAISFEGLQMKTRQIEIVKRSCRVQKGQPDAGRLLNRLESAAELSIQ